MEILKKSPAWKEAVDQIVSMVEKSGYGCFISHGEILNWLDLEEPISVEGYKQFSFLRLGYTEQMKDALLTDHCIYLQNERGEGYIVLTPDDQVKKAPAAHMKKAISQIKKATESVMHVDTSKLSADGCSHRMRNLSKLAFIGSTISSKRVFISAE